MSDSMTEITLTTRIVQLRAELVADHWRKAALRWGDDPMPGRMLAHPLTCVLAALRGESDPRQLGVDEGSEEFTLLSGLVEESNQ